MSAPTARVLDITKSFGGPPVLEDVSIEFLPGEVHVLAGENGAGKSTLIRILGGAIGGYRGRIELGGVAVQLKSPHDAAKKGVALIHQELSLVPEMSVLDNLLLGFEPSNGGLRSMTKSRHLAKELLDRISLEVDLDTPVRRLPLATCQLLEVAKALRQDASIVAMDEPTSALNSQEVEHLFRVIDRLKAEGKAIIYISHKMEEIHRLADQISVLRDGRLIGTFRASDVGEGELIAMMVGGKQAAAAEHDDIPLGEEALAVSGLTVANGNRIVVKEATLTVRAGEVVGLAGLQGAGSSELMGALFGTGVRILQGEVALLGNRFRPGSPQRSIAAGLALLTNDRKGTGLVLPLSVEANTTLVALPRLTVGGWRSPGRERTAAQEQANAFRLRAPSLDSPVSDLSGGNQQKVALAKWILARPKVLLLDEPTRGIDIGAKREIYELIRQWKSQGMAILLITSELPELLMLCDRILVMHRGRIVREFGRSEATGEKVIQAAMDVETA